jgi:TRAP-type C4-dicarboxylate transport system permease small subunit
MSENSTKTAKSKKSSVFWVFIVLLIIGLVTFIYEVTGQHPERAWQAYLINFLLWSGIAQGAVLFSTVMHMTKARWSGPLSGLSESFAAFFPLSFILFLLLFLGKTHIFPWLHEDLHGKEIWLNIPFLFTRDCIGLLVLYFTGFGYLYNALQLRIDPNQPDGKFRKSIVNAWQRNNRNPQRIRSRMTMWAGFYILAFAIVLCLIGYDLVMSMDPHWISTLFGAYHFVKAFFVGLGALIILAAFIRIRKGDTSGLKAAHFHDIGKLFFAFCLLWADFFYVQLMVIYYGNIPEETHYVIVRTILTPWNRLAWGVFIVCFVAPFFILLNKKIKTMPVFMVIICSVVIIGIWFEHLLLLGPALNHHADSITLGFEDALISLGFLGLMVIAIAYFLRRFPEIIQSKERGVS